MELHGFLKDVKGVLHVGASYGEERDVYRNLDLNVVWIEAIPSVFEVLKANIQGYPKCRAYNCLIADRDDQEYTFHVSSNGGASSSIYNFKLHRKMWHDVRMVEKIKLKSMTMPSLIKQNNIDLSDYGAMVIDTQGSELLVLRGSLTILPRIEYILTEVADFEAYHGCCQLSDMEAFFKEQGYREICRTTIHSKKRVGSYFDIVYRRSAV